MVIPSSRIRYADLLVNTVAVAFLLLLIHKAFVDVDLRNFDSLAYHLPFAGRLVGLVPREELRFVDHLEEVYQGFPLLGELLEGVLWYFFGLMQAANLVALGSLVVFCYFAATYLAVPAGSLFVALLAVPLIQIHATASLVDLPANLACAAALMVAFRLYSHAADRSVRDIVLFCAAGAVAVNTKFQSVPIVGLLLVAVAGRLLFLYRSGRDEVDGTNRRMLRRMMWVLVAGSPIVFASLIKNTLVFGNPFYPVAFGLLGWSLPHTMTSTVVSPLYLQDAPQALRWLLSVFEFRAYDARRPILWTGEQGYLPAGVPADRMGGYFFIYVIFSLVLFAVLVRRHRSGDGPLAAGFFAVVSVVTAVLPQSHELRYYMYWIVLLITLNFHFLVRRHESTGKGLRAAHLGIMSCVVLITTVVLTKGLYVRPSTQPIVVGITESVEPAIRTLVEKTADICVLGNTNLFLLYTTDFHPSMRYSVKAAYEPKQCGTRPILRTP